MKAALAVVIFVSTSQVLLAQAVFNNPRLDAFVADLVDPADTRHYRLVSKQAAVHKWLINHCMQELGFVDATQIDSKPWQSAMYGEYSYCQDHYIPGIDAPCPSEELVEQSINNSCHERAYRQLDWSHTIMHVVKKELKDEQALHKNDPIVQGIESHWSDCMKDKQLNFNTRVDMYASFGVVGAESANADFTQTKILAAAEQCYASTGYHEKQAQFVASTKTKYFLSQRNLVSSLLDRYEAAEQQADKAIAEYCEQDRQAIVGFYEQETYTEEKICQ